MDKNIIFEIIRKFLDGNCSTEEFSYLLYWYESFDENVPLPISEEEKERLRIRILSRIKSNIPEISESEKKDKSGIKSIGRRKILKIWKYTAAAVIIALISWSGIIYFSRGKNTLTNGNQSVVNENRMMTLSNRSNRVHPLFLPDSSKVWLNPGSKLQYLEHFTGKERKVLLTGKAFFDIKHDPDHPFIVIGGNLITTVLGTRFFFRTDENSQSEVTVLSGKVAVSKINEQKEKVILNARQSVMLSKNDKLVKESKGDNKTLQRWQNLSLTFNNVPFYQVMQTLNKKFGVEMHCRNEQINRYQINADFNNQNLPDILEMLEKSLNINYEMKNDTLIDFYNGNQVIQ